jgi:hypothetical protein
MNDINALCRGCSRDFGRDPRGIESMSSRGADGVIREWKCNWLITIHNTAECPCQECLIKSVCWDQCEEFNNYKNRTWWRAAPGYRGPAPQSRPAVRSR